MPFSHIPHIEITDSSARFTSAFILGLAQVVLGVMLIVQGVVQMNQSAVSSGLRMVADGALEMFYVIKARERSWVEVGKQAFSVVSVLVLDIIFGKVLEH